MPPKKNSRENKGETDAEIIEQYKKGDSGAFKRLIDKYLSPLYNFAASRAPRDDAPDIAQEIFIKVWKHIDRFDENKASFKTWIFTIARNTITDYLRKKKSLSFSDIKMNDDDDSSIDSYLLNIPDEQMLSDAVLQKMQDKKLVEQMLNKMKPNYREILVLHYQEEMTFDEIGKVLGKPLNTVKSGHRRALMELRKELQ